MSRQVPFSDYTSIYSLENCFLGKLLCYFISLQIFRGIYFFIDFPANDIKPTERFSFSTELLPSLLILEA
jgi:hypothetical protein